MNARDLVELLAQALDDDDYVTAATTMAADVAYEVGGETLTGPDSVLASYRESSETAHEIFDEVGYDHEIAAEGPGIFRVYYSDILTLGGETLHHKAEQVVTVVPDRGIVHILDEPVTGERERVDEFLSRHGIAR